MTLPSSAAMIQPTEICALLKSFTSAGRQLSEATPPLASYAAAAASTTITLLNTSVDGDASEYALDLSTATPTASVSRLNRITYGYIAPVIIAIGIVGDLLTVATLSHPILRRSSRVYQQLTILAITDLLMHLSIIPMIMWLLDMRLCSRWSAFYYAHLGFPLANALMGASVYIVVFLTFSQYTAVCWPFRRQSWVHARRTTIWVLVVAYALNFCLYAPWATKKFVHVVPPGVAACCFVICDSQRIDRFFRSYELAREFLTRIAPFLLVAYFNVQILRTYRHTRRDRLERLAYASTHAGGGSNAILAKSEQVGRSVARRTANKRKS